MVLAALLAGSCILASPNAIRGLPFTRSYPLEEVGEVPRGARLSFDRFGRLAVIHEGVYTVLNDSSWLDIAAKEKSEVGMTNIVQGDDGRSYYGGSGSWGIVELMKDGKLRPHPLLTPDAPKWVLTTGFNDIVITDQGAYFAGWNGVVYWDFETRKNSYFAIYGVSKIFKVGSEVYVSCFGGALQSIDVKDNTLHAITDTGLGDSAINQATSLDKTRCLVSTREGRILTFDGRQVAPWPGQLRNNITGLVSDLIQLADGGIAVAITGKGLFVASAEGELHTSLTSPEYHRITHLATREPGVLWAIGEDGIQKVHYGSPLTVFGQRLGITLSWPIVIRWNGKILVGSGGRLFEAIPVEAGSPSRFELLNNLPAGGAWAVTASGPHLLIGNANGAFARAADGDFSPVISDMDVARLAMLGSDLCFVIGRREIAVIRWADGRWTECAPRIAAVGYPAVVQSSKHAVWVEMGNNRVARLFLQGGRLQSRVLEDFPWKAGAWVNIGIIDDTIVLNGPQGSRVFYDDKTERFVEAPQLRRLLDQSSNWILRIQKDEKGTLWATHEQGVTIFVPKDGDYQIDPRSFSLNNERFPIVLIVPENDVWIATGQSLYHVERREALEKRKPLRPMLVSVADGRSNAELFVDTNASEGMLRLPYARNSLNFRFFSGSYAWRRAPIYEFRLNSVQDHWASLGTGSLLSFPGLREGIYRLQVRIANSQGPAGIPASFEFEILPPWHRTWSTYILSGVCLVLAVFGLVRWSVYRAHHRNIVLEGLVKEQTDQLRTTMQKLNEETRNAATLAERDRLAGEIHDSMQQGLSGLILQLDATLKLPALTDDIRSRLNVARNMVSFTRHEVQHAVWDMESPLLEDTELGEALRKITALISPGTAKIEISVTGSPAPLPSAIKHHLLRIAQEAITNAVRHASPGKIEIRLEYRMDSVSLTVADDGLGFHADNVLAKSIGHFGLRGLRGRANKIGGKLLIESVPGKGTSISIVVALANLQYPSNDAVTPKA